MEHKTSIKIKDSNFQFGLIIAGCIAILLVVNFVSAHYKDVNAARDFQVKAVKDINALYSSGKYDKAIRMLDAYLKKFPDDFKARSLLASAYIVTNQVEPAYQEAKKVYDHKPSPDIAYQLALLADKLGKNSEAIRYLKEAVKSRPDSLPFRTTLADLYMKNKKFNEAIDELNAALKLLPKDSPYRAEILNKIKDAYARIRCCD